MYKLRKDFINKMIEKRRHLLSTKSSCKGTCSECVICDIVRMASGKATFEELEKINERLFAKVLDGLQLKAVSGGLKIKNHEGFITYKTNIAQNVTICRL